jgi:membrane fusion protein (multidrug efflux system)
MTRNGHIALRALALTASVLAAACSHDDGTSAVAAPPALPVTVVSVHAQNVPVSLETVGQAEGSRDVEIRARVTGILEKRVYEEGATVQAGQLLFVIDPAPFELAVLDARAALQQARVARELAAVDVKRLAPLAADKAISQRDLDQAEATEKTATAAIASAEAKLKEAELNLSYTKVAAPISGITGRAQRSEGSLVTANADSSLLTTLTQVNPIWVRFSLADTDYGRIRGAERSARVQIVNDANAVVADDGKLNFTASTVDTKLGTVQLRAQFPNPGTRWLPGQFVKVRVLAGEQSAILVPQQAILQNEQSRMVMTAGRDGKAAAKSVKIANWIGTNAVVTAGLADGDMVIIDNLVKVRPGSPVQPHEPGTAPAVAAQAAPTKTSER